MATIHDVAIATGVSDATVSRALRGMNSKTGCTNGDVCSPAPRTTTSARRLRGRR